MLQRVSIFAHFHWFNEWIFGTGGSRLIRVFSLFYIQSMESILAVILGPSIPSDTVTKRGRQPWVFDKIVHSIFWLVTRMKYIIGLLHRLTAIFWCLLGPEFEFLSLSNKMNAGSTRDILNLAGWSRVWRPSEAQAQKKG